MIKIWHSYSCNNSSSYRLIARFADAATARDASAALIEAIAAGTDERSSLQGLARKYGFDWRDEGWGGPEDGPHVLAEDELVIVHHDYCLGFGPGIPALLVERGAVVGTETWADLQISVLFRTTPGVDPRLDNELAALLAQARDGRRADQTDVEPLSTPWAEHPGARGPIAMFRDPGAFGMAVPIKPRDIARLKAWLADHGIEGAVIRFDEPTDETLFATLATARCTACSGALEYLDPRLHDIETPQLVCKPCGGLYELAAFVPAG